MIKLIYYILFSICVILCLYLISNLVYLQVQDVHDIKQDTVKNIGYHDEFDHDLVIKVENSKSLILGNNDSFMNTNRSRKNLNDLNKHDKISYGYVNNLFLPIEHLVIIKVEKDDKR